MDPINRVPRNVTLREMLAGYYVYQYTVFAKCLILLIFYCGMEYALYKLRNEEKMDYYIGIILISAVTILISEIYNR